MGQSVKSIVKPSLLIWARKKSGLSIEEIAHRLSNSPERYREWENGKDSPASRSLPLPEFIGLGESHVIGGDTI